VLLNRDDIIALLRGMEVLGELPDAALATLASNCRPTATTRGQLIFTRGDPAALFAVAQGHVVICAKPGAGVEMRLFTRRPRQLFGELSLVLDRQIDEARTSESALILHLGAERVHAVLRESQPATLSLARVIANRMAETEARLSAVALGTVKDRLRQLLESLAADSGIADSRGYLIRDRLTHAELARMVGTGRVTISRALRVLRQEGKIILDRRRIIIPKGLRIQTTRF